MLQNGGLIAYPTEAVWGLGCDPFNEAAVNRLLSLKQRPVEKGLILVASKLDQLGSLLHDLTVEQQAIISQVTERPTTWLVPDINKRIPIWIKGQHQQVAIRLSRHPLTARLCEETGSLLVSTSANESGEETLDNAKAIQKRLGKGLALILDGSLGGETQASEIKDLKTGKVFR